MSQQVALFSQSKDAQHIQHMNIIRQTLQWLTGCLVLLWMVGPAFAYVAPGTKVCPPGQQPDSRNVNCLPCPTGTYKTTNRGTCQPCSAGKYQDQTGQTSCKECPAGRYQDQTGQSSCKQCERGRYNPNTGSSSASACQA